MTRLSVLAQRRALLKMIPIGQLFPPFPIKPIILKSRFMNNYIKPSGLGHLKIGRSPLQSSYVLLLAFAFTCFDLLNTLVSHTNREDTGFIRSPLRMIDF